MSKFGGIDYIFNVHDIGTSASDKNIITRSALSYANYLNIPLSRRFTTRKRESDQRSKFDLRFFSHKDEFTFLTETSLKPVTVRDKLFIFAHANSTDVGFTQARLLASMLEVNGLKKVGLISFKACEVGVGTFLEDFVVALEKRGVMVGWVKGYKGSAITKTAKIDGVVTKVYEKIVDDDDKLISGDDRIKIVRGNNNDFTESFGRYTIA